MHNPDEEKIGNHQTLGSEGSPTYRFINDLPSLPVEPKDNVGVSLSPSLAFVYPDFSSPEATTDFNGHSIPLHQDVCPEDFHGSIPTGHEGDNEIWSFDKAIMEHNIGTDAVQPSVEVQNEHYQATPNKEEGSPHVTNRVEHLDKEEDRFRLYESDVMMPLQTPNPCVHNIILAVDAINPNSKMARPNNEAGKPNICISAYCKASKDTEVEIQRHGKRRCSLAIQNKASSTNTRSINQQEGNSLSPNMAPCTGMLSNTPAISQFLKLTDPLYSIIDGKDPFSVLFNATQDKLPIGVEAQSTNTDIFEAPECGTNKKSRQSGPRLMEAHNDKSGDCKLCKCKMSSCLKLYCECFAAGIYCTGNCRCQQCLNNPKHQQRVEAARKGVISRNALAFTPKIVPDSEHTGNIIMEDDQNTPASIRHKNGCNCMKSACQKKYCECYQGGVACSQRCRCNGCKNKFGTKNGENIAAKSLTVDSVLKDKRNVIMKESDDRSLRKPIPLAPSLERSRGIISSAYGTSREQPCSSTHPLTLNKPKLPLLSNIEEQLCANKENVFIPVGKFILGKMQPMHSITAERFDFSKDNNIITSRDSTIAVEVMNYDTLCKTERSSHEKENVDDIYYGESSSMNVANNTSPSGRRVSHSSGSVHLSQSVVDSRAALVGEGILLDQPSLNYNLTNDNIMHPSRRSFK